MISLKTFFHSTDSSKFRHLSSIFRRQFSRPARSAPIAGEKIRSIIEPLGGFFRRVVLGEERAESNRATAENAEMEETNLEDKLRNLEEENRDLKNQKRCESVENVEVLIEKIDPVVAPKREKQGLSALFTEKRGQSKPKREPKSKPAAELKSAAESKPEAELKSAAESKPAAELKSAAESKQAAVPAPMREKRGLSALFTEKRGQSKPKPKSKPAAELKSAEESKLAAELKSAMESKPAAELARVDQTVFGNEDPMIHRELSPDMKIFAEHLYTKGYLKNANFLRKNRFDPALFKMGYARDYLKFGASEFGNDHLEVARSLSAEDLEKIAVFGCPNLGYKTVSAAKHMRSFFRIGEHKVCEACTLKETCKYRNESIGKESTKLHLGSVMKVLIMYAMESFPRNLEVPQEITDSASRLLLEILRRSRETS